MWEAVTRSSEPYQSIAAESLAAHGFVVPDGSSLVYYAPDARTLISDAFARGHCFRPIERDDHPGEIGLAFAPIARVARRHRDVSGALWIERATGRLIDLELTYAVPPELASVAAPPASARVEYAQTSTGRWIVQHWVLRMPVLTLRTVMAPRNGGSLQMGAMLSREQVPTLSAIREAGGDVVRTLASADTALDAVGVVRGRFVDTVSERGVTPHVEGVRGIRVALVAVAGTVADARYAATSDSAGEFVIANVRPGRYAVTATGDLLDTLAIHVPEREVDVAAAESHILLTTLPSAATVERNFCPDGVDDAEAILHGSVRDERDAPIRGAKIVVSWFDLPDQRDSHFVATSHTVGSVTQRDGSYVVCGIPRGRPLGVQALADRRKSAVSALDRSSARVRMLDLVVPRTAPQ